MRRNKQINVSRALALAGAFNFLISAAKACLLPFFTLYLRHLGLTPTETGFVMGTKHAITLAWSPIAGLLSKHYNKRRVLVNSCLVVSATAAIVIPVIPPADVHKIRCNNSISLVNPTQSSTDGKQMSASLTSLGNFKSASSSNVSMEVPIALKEAKNNTSVPKIEAIKKRKSNVRLEGNVDKQSKLTGNTDNNSDSLKEMDNHHQLFFLILIAVSVLTAALAPLEWTADDGLFEYLDFADAADRYSNSKTWSLIGGAFGVCGSGVFVSQLSCLLAAETPRSVVHFVCFSIITLGTVPIASFLPFYLNKKRTKPDGLVKGLQLVRGSVRAVLCATTILLVGIVISTVENFLLWEMQDNGSNELHMGLSLALGLISQVSFPLFVVKVSKILSSGRVLVLGATIVSVQCLYFSFLWGPWAVLPAQILNTLSFGGLWWAVQVQCDDIATPGTERSVARVYSALSLDLGRALGSVIGGAVVQKFGIAWMFRGAALGLIMWCFVLALLQVKAPRQRRINYSRLLAADASEASESESEQERDWLDKAIEDDQSNNNSGRRIYH
ncbi:major facilitator superfamily domain-containing protein 6-like [Boleophthalmus pectinirostris]|uniref:major facilitator superfamily domain-containing protein 6-like n=1 Tax=Boleophthalmus pectinirostris TaxID=150288 RepID=UPI00242F2E39|nr:major facilitator superfamily domain-containing protein 6-like [Boleophthalmus pectinirostris]